MGKRRAASITVVTKDETKVREREAERVIARMELNGFFFAPNKASGWTVAGPSKGMSRSYDKDLMEYASEIASVLKKRQEYISGLRIFPEPETMQ